MRRAYTLVEVMVAFAVFSIAILGVIGLMTFGLKTIDDAKALNQATQILMNEMEAMRMRSWSDQGSIHGLKTLGTGITNNGAWDGAKLEPPGGVLIRSNRSRGSVSGTYIDAETTSSFTPYAVYGVAPVTGKTVATLGDEIKLPSTTMQLRAPGGYVCRRTVTLSRSTGVTDDVDTSTVTLTIAWKDSRGGTHSRSHIGNMSKNGLNDYLYRSFPAGK